MSTYTTTAAPSNASNAQFQAWVTAFKAMLDAGTHLVQTGDTGQMNVATATAPVGANTKAGNLIYRFDDGISNVYIRFDFGSAAAAANPGIWITIGTGSNGSGTITGVVYNGGGATNANLQATASSSTLYDCFGSAGTGRFSFALFSGAATTTYTLAFSIERTKSSAGADTADGLLLTFQAPSAANTYPGGGTYLIAMTQYVDLTGGSQPPADEGIQTLLANVNPSTFGSDVGVGVVGHFRGTLVQYGVGALTCRTSDFTLHAQPTIQMYGNNVTYVRIGSNVGVASGGSTTSDTTLVLLIRYD